jgi:hypothetical protein
MTQQDEVQSQALTQYQLTPWFSRTTLRDGKEMCEHCLYNEHFAGSADEYRHECTCGLENYMDQ